MGYSVPSGSHVSYLYPMSILNGEAQALSLLELPRPERDRIWIPVANVHAPNTSSYVKHQVHSKDGGVSTFRMLLL